jgi:hypothetical protein
VFLKYKIYKDGHYLLKTQLQFYHWNKENTPGKQAKLLINVQIYCGSYFHFIDQEFSSTRLDIQLFVGGFMSYLRYLCSFAYNGGQHTCVAVFLSSFCVLLPISMACPFLIAPSVFTHENYKNHNQFSQYFDVMYCCQLLYNNKVSCVWFNPIISIVYCFICLPWYW